MTPRRIRVTVTQDDIDFGKMSNTKACPIANAAHRLGYEDACVHSWGWCPRKHMEQRVFPALIRGGFAGRYQISERAHQFVRDFDAGLAVVPSIFYLDITD